MKWKHARRTLWTNQIGVTDMIIRTAYQGGGNGGAVVIGRVVSKATVAKDSPGSGRRVK